jgi:5-methylcytosine-specific restriction endonuclease McrA
MHAQSTAYRTCLRCGQSKPTSEFYTSKRYGYQVRCKPCDAQDRKERRARHDQAARDRQRYATDPDFKERRREMTRDRYAAGIPSNSPRTRAFRQELFDTARGICAVCGEPMAFEESSVDHIVPISRGGKHERENMQIAHRVCNSVKGVRFPGAVEITARRPL